MGRLFHAVLLAVSVLAAPASSAKEPVIVFAAASLKTALDDVVTQFNKVRGGAVTVSYAGSSALARQIENGAPADIFFSANRAWMNVLAESGLIDPASRRDLLGNRLVLIAPVSSGTKARVQDADSLMAVLQGERLAIALVNAVPAGIYAREAMQALGLWELLQPHLAQTNNVRAALRLVSLGEAPLGIVYATDAHADTGVKVVDAISSDLHSAIIYPVALLSPDPRDDAQAFYRFLTGPDAAQVFRNHGFLTVGENGE